MACQGVPVQGHRPDIDIFIAQPPCFDNESFSSAMRWLPKRHPGPDGILRGSRADRVKASTLKIYQALICPQSSLPQSPSGCYGTWCSRLYGCAPASSRAGWSSRKDRRLMAGLVAVNIIPMSPARGHILGFIEILVIEVHGEE